MIDVERQIFKKILRTARDHPMTLNGNAIPNSKRNARDRDVTNHDRCKLPSFHAVIRGDNRLRTRYFKKPGPAVEGVNFREGSLDGNSERKEGRLFLPCRLRRDHTSPVPSARRQACRGDSEDRGCKREKIKRYGGRVPRLAGVGLKRG